MSFPSINTNTNPRAVDDLIHMIDHHLAFNLSQNDHALRSQASNGTMFVDYDGTDVPVVSYRHHTHRSAASSATIGAVEDPRRDSVFDFPSEPRSSDARSSPFGPAVRAPSALFRRNYGGGGVFVGGVDRAMGWEYGYDGGVVHGHPCSGLSEYFEVDAGAYVRGLELERVRECHHRHHGHTVHSSSRRRHRRRHANNGNVPLKVVYLHKELPSPPAGCGMSKREKVAAFLAKVLEKLACMGLLDHSDRHRKCGHRHRRKLRSTLPPVPKTPEKWRK